MVELLPESQYFKKRCSALCAENDETRKNRILEYIQDGWEILRDGIGLLTTECKNTLTELLSIREKLEKINEILYDHDDIALYEDLDEFKAAQAFYQIGDYDLTIQYLSICLHKWTRLEENKKVSSWRGKEPLKEKSSKDIEVQVSSFIKLVNSRFASILSDDRVVKMLSEASKIAN